MKLTDTQAWAVAGALRTAAEAYDKSASDARDIAKELGGDSGNAGFERLAVQFDDQAKNARDLAEKFENASAIVITE